MSNNRKGPKGREALEEIEARLGTVFGALGAALKGAVDVASTAETAGKEGVEFSRDRKGRGEDGPDTGGRGAGIGPIRTHSSVRVRVGGLDIGDPSETSDPEERDVTRPVNRPSSSSREPKSAASEEPRPLTLTTNLEDGMWIVTAEVPGVGGDQVSVSVEGGTLSIEASGIFHYRGTIATPPGLDTASLTHRVTNGILELSGAVTPGERDA
ncbi:MAG: Hsp20/alpha crystallin family protein [Pseudomonadota bacterium]